MSGSTYFGPSSARQRTAIQMAFRWRANDGPLLNAGLVALWFFRVSRPVLLRNTIFLWFFWGGGGPDTLPPVWIRPWKAFFFWSTQKKITKGYKSAWYNMDIMQQSVCVVINTITAHCYGFLYNCTHNQWRFWQKKLSSVGWCLMLVFRPTLAPLGVFFSSKYLWIKSHFLCFIIEC